MSKLEHLKKQVNDHKASQQLASQLQETAVELRHTSIADRNQITKMVHETFWSEFANRLEEPVWSLYGRCGDFRFHTSTETIISNKNEEDIPFLDAVAISLGKASSVVHLDHACFRVRGEFATWYPKNAAFRVSLYFKSFEDLQEAIIQHGLSINWTNIDNCYRANHKDSERSLKKAEKNYAEADRQMHEWNKFKEHITAACPEQIKTKD